MKKIFSLFSILFSLTVVFAEIPEELKGIWNGNDRMIFFDGENEISIILKEYYGWYYDRAVEPERFSEIQKRNRNIATKKNGYAYSVNFVRIAENVPAWEMEISINEKNKSIIPIALVDGKIFLDFLLKIPYYNTNSENPELYKNGNNNENPLFGYWQGLNCADSIRICGRKKAENIISWYITENGAYHLRFWNTKMPNEDTKAVFSDDNTLYTINKHIFSAGENYTCVNGRGTNIRNVEKYAVFPHEYKMNESRTLLALGKEYLSKVEGKYSAEELLEIVKQANSRRKPEPPSPFDSLEHHRDLVEKLQNANQ